MKAIHFNGDRTLTVVTCPDPDPGPGQVVLRVEASGMCGSDLHTYRGPQILRPVVAGHEPSGVVVAVGEGVDPSWIDRSVLVHHYIGCERCDQCRAGWTQLCRFGAKAMGASTDGSHSEFMRVPVSTLLAMPEGLSFESAAAISCGTGTAWGALNRLQLRGDDTIVVFGQGPVGLAATQLASAMGSRVIAVDPHESRRAQSLSLGAETVLDPRDEEPIAEAVRAATSGRGATKSLDTSGASSAARAALDVLDLWGTACWVGVGSHLDFDVTELLYRQITAITSWTMSIPDMDRCARFILERGVDADAVFTERWSLDDAKAAYESFDTQRSGKGVFLPHRTA